jgi:hypothetical protein
VLKKRVIEDEKERDQAIDNDISVVWREGTDMWERRVAAPEH